MIGEAGWTIQVTSPACSEINWPSKAVEAEVEEVQAEYVSWESLAVYEPETEAYEETEAASSTDGEWTYLGCVRVTGYTWTGNTCANGNYPTSGYTVACNDLPIGTVVYIEGVGYRTVEDRGGMTRGTYWMDVYFDTMQECYAVTGYYDVYLVEE